MFTMYSLNRMHFSCEYHKNTIKCAKHKTLSQIKKFLTLEYFYYNNNNNNNNDCSIRNDS